MRVLSGQKPLRNVRNARFASDTLGTLDFLGPDTFFREFYKGKYAMVLAQYRSHNLIVLVAGIVF